MSDPQPVIRPARPSDIDAFLRLALAVGDGMTSMPPDEAILFQRLTASETRVAAGAEEILPDGIWLVLEAGDLEVGGNVLGTSAIFPTIGLDWPF